ncbi:MAG TPA: M28 family peptidase, partial [Thermoanaerobaculia bacterium]|nr:M28 family peptidase [Thermoanaerobaculia bacterium]
MRKTILGALAVLLPGLGLAQSSPFVDASTERALVNELSGDLAFETLRITTQWHKPSGSEGFFAVAREVEARAKAAGLQNVRWIDQVAQEPNWTCRSAEAWLLEGPSGSQVETKIASYAEVATSIADNSRPASVTAELVDVGAGETPADYAGKDVRGKIVLAYGSVGLVMEQAVWKRGAAGILSWSSSRLNALADSADQVGWTSVPDHDGPKGEKTTFAIVISARQGKALSDRMRGEEARRWGAGEAKPPQPMNVRVAIDSVVLPERKTAMVEARIPGTDPTLPEIVLTAHLQEEKFSANDDQSGVANVLEIGRALTRLIADGRLPRPRRGIRFWWADEIYSEYRYFADHPGEEKKFLANLNQDMVGAKQSDGHRTEYMARTPWSQPSFLSDVQQSILEAVVEGNNAYLAAWQAQTPPAGSPFSKPILSRLGTREPYRAKAVPYFDSTDHLV